MYDAWFQNNCKEHKTLLLLITWYETIDWNLFWIINHAEYYHIYPVD